MLDIAIRGGTIVDGTGAPSFQGDLGIKDGKIAAVGDNVGEAKREIDAKGAIVTPGFVDIHTHYDGQVSWDSLLAPSSINGVTSVVMGNCGVGFAPVEKTEREHLIVLLKQSSCFQRFRFGFFSLFRNCSLQSLRRFLNQLLSLRLLDRGKNNVAKAQVAKCSKDRR